MLSCLCVSPFSFFSPHFDGFVEFFCCGFADVEEFYQQCDPGKGFYVCFTLFTGIFLSFFLVSDAMSGIFILFFYFFSFFEYWFVLVVPMWG